ncbi:MAG: ribosome small subunit-dependent GTPase A [Rikenellaceae bacterium]
MSNLREGVVTKATGSWFEVESSGEIIPCRLRGKLRLKGTRSTSPVVVGDVVSFAQDSEGSYTIEEVTPRRNYIIRRASNLSKESHIIAANIDRAIVVVTLKNPKTPPEFIDRFLVTCEAYKIPATIVLQKIDLMQDDMQSVELFESIYRTAGYQTIRTSTLTGEGLDRVKELLQGATTLISGNSGVGKSTLIGSIEPTLDIKIGEISQSHNKGRHTTTFSTMYPLTMGGYIIDTPGIKGFGLLDIAPEELWHYFPEMMHYGKECQFYNCTHIHEPRCAVREAIEQREISIERYESYLKILSDDDKYRK